MPAAAIPEPDPKKTGAALTLETAGPAISPIVFRIVRLVGGKAESVIPTAAGKPEQKVVVAVVDGDGFSFERMARNGGTPWVSIGSLTYSGKDDAAVVQTGNVPELTGIPGWLKGKIASFKPFQPDAAAKTAAPKSVDPTGAEILQVVRRLVAAHGGPVEQIIEPKKTGGARQKIVLDELGDDGFSADRLVFTDGQWNRTGGLVFAGIAGSTVVLDGTCFNGENLRTWLKTDGTEAKFVPVQTANQSSPGDATPSAGTESAKPAAEKPAGADEVVLPAIGAGQKPFKAVVKDNAGAVKVVKALLKRNGGGAKIEIDTADGHRIVISHANPMNKMENYTITVNRPDAVVDDAPPAEVAATPSVSDAPLAEAATPQGARRVIEMVAEYLLPVKPDSNGIKDYVGYGVGGDGKEQKVTEAKILNADLEKWLSAAVNGTPAPPSKPLPDAGVVPTT